VRWSPRTPGEGDTQIPEAVRGKAAPLFAAGLQPGTQPGRTRLELGEDVRDRAQVTREQAGSAKDGEKRAGFFAEETGGA